MRIIRLQINLFNPTTPLLFDIMKSLILAAGEGLRLRPITETIPKVMIPLAGTPIIEYVVNALVKNGITDISIVVGYKKEAVMDHFGDGARFGAKISYVFQERQLGTAHALLVSQSALEGESEFLVLGGDNVIFAETLYSLLESSCHAPALLAKNEPHNVSQYGAVTLKGKNLVEKLDEKPRNSDGALISLGIYKFNGSVFDVAKRCVGRGELTIPHIIRELTTQKFGVRAVVTDGAWMDVVYPWDMLKVNGELMSSLLGSTAGTIEEGVVIKGNVEIGRGSTIRSGSYIVGPVRIGAGCDIGPCAYVSQSTLIGDNAAIGPFSCIKNSLVGSDSKIGSGCRISDSIISQGAAIGSNSSNTSGPCRIEVGNTYEKAELFGFLAGEDVVIGDGVVAREGTILGRGCNVAPLKVIQGTIPSNARVI